MRRRSIFIILALTTSSLLPAQEKAPPPAGQRVLTAGHSFHVFMPGILRELAQTAGIKDHAQVDLQSIGGSRVIQHWNVPDEKNKIKPALKAGKADVLTLSPIYLPDEGIENFVKLAVESNPKVRITVQEFWLPFDVYAPNYQKMKVDKVDRNTRTGETMRKEHDPYFKSMDAEVERLNKLVDKQAVCVVPVGQAVIALREKIIAGQAPGLKMQEDLFTDPIGHPRPPLQALAAYCHYAVIYRQSPVGLPAPAALAKSKLDDADKLNQLLQELAWQAATQHPLSGVKGQQ